jgi:polyribonucleotide nucleotidyltransferase
MANEDFSKYLIMTDLAYMEDAFGLLDFKMTGTKTGVTAIQSDMKSKGIPFEILPKIIEQSKEGRLHVLEIMEKAISKPRDSVSQYAPKTVSIKIEPEKIGMVIGSGGKTIREIQERTETEISIEEDGTVVVSSTDKNKAQEAADIVANLVKDVKAGEVYDGVVQEVVDFGAFVELLPGKVGLLHISEISNDFVTEIDEVIKAGDEVKVKVLDVSRDGKMSLSKKILEPGADTNRDNRQDRGRQDRGRQDRGRPRSSRGKRPNKRYN